MTTPIVYPWSLPGPAAASITSAERRLLAPDDGPFDARAVQRDRLATQQLTFPPFTADETAAFWQWWRDALNRGGAWFAATWPLPQGFVSGVRKFVGVPKRQRVNGFWQVSAICEVRGRGLAPNQPSDPYASNVVLHVRFNGPDGSTSFTDLTGRHTLAAVGGAHVSTAHSTLALGSSLALDGAGAYVSVSDNLSDFDLGTGALTIEGWRFQSGSTGTLQSVMGCNGWEYILADNRLSDGINTSFSGSGSIGAGLSPAMPQNAWRMFAFCFDGTNGIIFDHGKAYPGTKTGTPHFGFNTDMRLGANGAPGFPYFWKGNLQEIRITKGIQRYSTDFVPPTVPFPA